MARRIAFLNLDRDKHHTPHILPMALACSTVPDWECVFYTQNVSVPVVDAILPLYPDHACRIETPKPARWKTLARQKRGIGSSHFMKRLAEEFGSYDALVTPDTNLAPFIRTHRGKRPLLVYAFHGSGDRRYPFRADVKDMDCFLLPGDKFLKRRRILGQLENKQWAVVGYPKLELLERQPKQRLFSNSNPTVIYNPHHDQHTSSWYPWGLRVLEFFLAHGDRYNLIVAPHILIKPSIPARFREAVNILIDVSSPALVDGTYVRNADLYLGDISSQVYEFIAEPRPAIFLNPRGINPGNDPDYASWKLGPVVSDFETLGSRLRESFEENTYREKQRAAVQEAFSINERPPTQRVIGALADFFQNRRAL